MYGVWPYATFGNAVPVAGQHELLNGVCITQGVCGSYAVTNCIIVTTVGQGLCGFTTAFNRVTCTQRHVVACDMEWMELRSYDLVIYCMV